MRTARLRALALGVGLVLTALSTGRAADQTMTLAIGSGSVFTLERPFDTVLIDQSDVVDIHCQGNRSVILKALKMFGILPGELFRMRELIKGRLSDPALSSS